jgi:hypothetical protein
MPLRYPRNCPGPQDRRFWLKVGGLSLGALTTGAAPRVAQLLAAEASAGMSGEIDPDFSVILRVISTCSI